MASQCSVRGKDGHSNRQYNAIAVSIPRPRKISEILIPGPENNYLENKRSSRILEAIDGGCTAGIRGFTEDAGAASRLECLALVLYDFNFACLPRFPPS